MWKILAILLALLAVAVAALHLPTRPRLELYDVTDLTYTLSGFPSVDIPLSSAASIDPIMEVDLLTGMDLAAGLQFLVPGSDVPVQFQNGLVIVRGTAIQHLAVRAALTTLRIRISAAYAVIGGITRAKAALSARLFGMITK